MKQIIRFSLNNKFALLILTFIVTVSGIYSSLNMKTEMFPDISVPVVTVSSNYPGAAPDEVMEEVTKPIEQRTRDLSGVTMVSSSSMKNASQVTIQYDFAKDMIEAEEEVQGTKRFAASKKCRDTERIKDKHKCFPNFNNKHDRCRTSMRRFNAVGRGTGYLSIRRVRRCFFGTDFWTKL